MPHLTLRKDAKPVVFAPYHACFASDCVRTQRLSLVFARYHGCLISSPPAPGMRGKEWRYESLAKAKVTTSGLRWVAVLWLLRSHTVRTTLLSVPESVLYSRSQQHVHDNIDDDNKARGGTQ